MLSFKEEVLKMKLQSVEEFFHKRETVEKYNVDKIIKLNWECPDVLFSFRGVYAIGVFIYYRQLFGDNVKTDIKVKDEKGATRQRLYSDKFLSENYPQFSDVNDLPEIKGFLEHYYDIGNIIPTWPGANITMGLTVAMCVAITYRGMAHCYDIPNVYYKRHAKFTKLVYGSIYRSVFIEEILENDKYDTVEKLLKLKPEQYVKFLEYIVDVIINRNKQLQDILQEENGHE